MSTIKQPKQYVLPLSSAKKMMDILYQQIRSHSSNLRCEANKMTDRELAKKAAGHPQLNDYLRDIGAEDEDIQLVIKGKAFFVSRELFNRYHTEHASILFDTKHQLVKYSETLKRMTMSPSFRDYVSDIVYKQVFPKIDLVKIDVFRANPPDRKEAYDRFSDLCTSFMNNKKFLQDCWNNYLAMSEEDKKNYNNC